MASTALTEALLDEAHNRVSLTLARHERILVVGSPRGTFPDQWIKHPRILLWPTTEANASDGTKHVPAEVGAIFISTMVSYELQRNVSEQAKQRGIWCSGILSPGTIKRIIEPPLSTYVPPKPPPPPPLQLKVVPSPAQAALPAPEEPAGDEVTHIIDDAIAAFTLIRDAHVAQAKELHAAQAERDDLRKKLEMFSALQKLMREAVR